MICPKCGFEQPDGSTDCPRCGVVFSRYRANGAAGTGETILPVEPLREETSYGGPLAPPAAPPPQLYGDALPPPPPGYPRLHTGRPFELGAILAETFETYFANFLPFLVLTALAFAPVIVYEVLMPTQAGTLKEMLRTGGVALLLRLLCAPLATATITFGVFQRMRGRETSISDSLRVGLSYLLPVLGVAVLQARAIVLGLALCILPGVLVAVMLAVAVPVAVEERPGLFAALERSGKLTEGYRLHIFGVLFILGILTLGVGLLVGLVSVVLASVPALAVLLRESLALLTSGVSATAAAVMYYRLRSVKESVDLENIASVFD
jgi:hypothetical protein